MAPLVSLAISAASKFIPELIGSALDSKKAEEVARVVTDAAVQYTGAESQHEALKQVENDQTFWNQQHGKIIKLIEIEVADVQHAREHVNDGVTKHLSYFVMLSNPVWIGLCIWGLIYLSEQPISSDMKVALSAVLGGAINNFFQERQQVMNFRFGSSLGSKLKNMFGKEGKGL